jgi:hypothetical protein
MPKPVEERTKPLARAFQDMVFHVANTISPLIYPCYKTHRLRHPAHEYVGWGLRLPRIAPMINDTGGVKSLRQDS